MVLLDYFYNRLKHILRPEQNHWKFFKKAKSHNKAISKRQLPLLNVVSNLEWGRMAMALYTDLLPVDLPNAVTTTRKQWGRGGEETGFRISLTKGRYFIWRNSQPNWVLCKILRNYFIARSNLTEAMHSVAGNCMMDFNILKFPSLLRFSYYFRYQSEEEVYKSKIERKKFTSLVSVCIQNS